MTSLAITVLASAVAVCVYQIGYLDARLDLHRCVWGPWLAHRRRLLDRGEYDVLRVDGEAYDRAWAGWMRARKRRSLRQRWQDRRAADHLAKESGRHEVSA